MAFCPVVGVVLGSYFSMWLITPESEIQIPGELFALAGMFAGFWAAMKIGQFFDLPNSDND